jgi:hypothetical protein
LKGDFKIVPLGIATAMNKTGNKTKNSSAGIVLLLLLIFLVFGFCPLRNTLSALLRQVPQTTAPKAPEYVKITAPDDCSRAVVVQPATTSGKLHVPPVQVAWLPEPPFAIGLRSLIVVKSYKSRSLTVPAVPDRIYLRNRCLLI